ncbi:MAG: ABC transporter permease [Chloroflexi bacterium]|nr:ABC transporter permease [Chloroflexota bacterium]
MRSILVISRREITRLRSRFTGRSRLFVLGIFAFAALLSFVIYHQGPIISKALYDIGVSPNGPSVADERFNVLSAGGNAGYAMLDENDIDLYVPGDEVVSRPDDQSQYTAGAFKQYIERQELLRISEEYKDNIDQAFPLRIEVHHLDESPGDGGPVPVAALRLLEPEDPAIDGQSVPMVPNVPEVSGFPALEPDPFPSAAAPSASESEIPMAAELEPSGVGAEPAASATDDAVRRQLEKYENSSGMPEFKAEFASESEIIVPSLMTPPIPLSQVLIAFFYVVPIFFVSVFFTSSFMEEKTNRKLVILLSAPVTPLQIILGKMLPYIGYSILAIIVITVVLGGNVGLGLAIFVPIMLFVLSIYLMVALLYRTFKDQTFFSVLAVWIVTAYLVAPAMFTGVNDLSFISPLTLAVLMYRGESFTVSQYFLSTLPMYMVFAVTMFVGVRIFNEEYLMGFRPLYRKLSEVMGFLLNPKHLSLSVAFLSFILIPVAFMVQFASITLASNLATPVALGVIFVFSIITEEIAKSAGIAVLLQNGMIRSYRGLVKLAFMSALGFLIGEKLLLFLALSVISDSMFTDAVFSSGLLIAPLVMHFIATAVVCLVTMRLGVRYYAVGILAGSVLHTLYNLWVLYGIGGITP